MTDYTKLNESQLAKLSIDELKQVVKSMKMARLSEVQQREDSLLEAKRERKRLRSSSRNASKQKPSSSHHRRRHAAASAGRKKILASSRPHTAAPPSSSTENRIHKLEQELEVAKDLDSSFSNISNEEKRRRLAQLRRSLMREKYRQKVQHKRQTEHYEPPVTPSAAWKKSLRRDFYEPSNQKKHKQKRASSAGKQRGTRRGVISRASSPSINHRDAATPKRRASVSRPRSAQRVRPTSAISRSRLRSPSSMAVAVGSTSKKRKHASSASTKANAKIAARLRDVEDQIVYLEKRLSKRKGKKSTNNSKRRASASHGDNPQLRQISEQLATMASKQSKMRHTVSSLKQNIVSIHENQSDQKLLMERLTRAVIKHRKQQQEYNDNFDRRLQVMQERTESIENQQERFRHSLSEHGTGMTHLMSSSEEDSSVAVFSPPSDAKGANRIGSSLSEASTSKILTNGSTDGEEEYVSKYSKLKHAFHRVYGARATPPRSSSRQEVVEVEEEEITEEESITREEEESSS